MSANFSAWGAKESWKASTESKEDVLLPHKEPVHQPFLLFHVKFHAFKASLKIRLSWVGANFYNNQHQRLSLARWDTLCLLLSCFILWFLILDFIKLFSQLSLFTELNATSYLLITPLFRNSSPLSSLSLIVPLATYSEPLSSLFYFYLNLVLRLLPYW
jgi:hypothetical protein